MSSKLRKFTAFDVLAADDPRVKELNLTPVESMWAGAVKRFADLSLEKLNARCVIRGDLHIPVKKPVDVR